MIFGQNRHFDVAKLCYTGLQISIQTMDSIAFGIFNYIMNLSSAQQVPLSEPTNLVALSFIKN